MRKIRQEIQIGKRRCEGVAIVDALTCTIILVEELPRAGDSTSSVSSPVKRSSNQPFLSIIAFGIQSPRYTLKLFDESFFPSHNLTPHCYVARRCPECPLQLVVATHFIAVDNPDHSAAIAFILFLFRVVFDILQFQQLRMSRCVCHRTKFWSDLDIDLGFKMLVPASQGVSPSSRQIHSGGLPFDTLEIRQKITLLALENK